MEEKTQSWGTEKIGRILLRLAPPVMLAQLIQALYNIIDSFFVGSYSDTGLTALSIVYPLQLLMIAIAVGTGVGINTVMAAKLGQEKRGEAEEYAGVATPLAVVLWALFAAVCWAIMPFYARVSTDSAAVMEDVIVYGRIVCVFSFGLFLESVWTKVLQANGDMKTPMIAQIAGAVVNIVLDPLLIFGMFGLPATGVAGAAVATVAGQVVAALVVVWRGFRKPPALRKCLHHAAHVFRSGLPNILMQSAYTFYILGLNLILSTFSDQAVTALGLYYKWQTIFFIPLGAMQTCIVPVVSYNYAARNIRRCKKTLFTAIWFGLALMAVGTLCFLSIPAPMLRVFTDDERVVQIGQVGFRFVGVSFLPMVTSLIFPVFFQAVGSGFKSSLLTVIRTVVLFVPLGYLFSRLGLNWFWMAFPVTETVTSAVGAVFYLQFLKQSYVKNGASSLPAGEESLPQGEVALKPSVPGVIVTIAREHGSSGKQIGKAVAQAMGVPFYCKELIALAAQESGLDREFIRDIHKNSPAVLRSLYLRTHAVQRAVDAQAKIIRRIAENGSCVIVGRAADSVLHNVVPLFRVFVRASEESRIARIAEIYGDTPSQAKKHIRRSDRARAAFYRHISGNRWGDAKNYDLVVDASAGRDAAVQAILRALPAPRGESGGAAGGTSVPSGGGASASSGGGASVPSGSGR